MTAAPHPDALQAQLERVAAFEAKVRPGPLTAVLRRVGRSAAFAGVYRRLGPRIDPQLQRIGQGSFVATLYGLPGLLLHTTGAKSGKSRNNPLLYVRDGDDFVVVGTNFGQPKHPAWTANLLANPDASVQIGPELVHVRAELVDDERFAEIFPRLVAVYPGYASYLERRGDLPPRMFLLHPVLPAAADDRRDQGLAD